MKVAIFSGGEFSSVKILPYDKLICADKGYDYAQKLNLAPDVILGDFDSLKYFPKNATVYDTQKDFSDTHLAFEKAISLGATEIHLYFALGGRLDHLLFNVNLLKLAKDKGVNAKIIEDTFYAQIVSGKVEFNAHKGKVISLVPFTENAHIINSKGLKYEIKDVTVKKGETLTLSNVATSDCVQLEIGSGELLLVNFL